MRNQQECDAQSIGSSQRRIIMIIKRRLLLVCFILALLRFCVPMRELPPKEPCCSRLASWVSAWSGRMSSQLQAYVSQPRAIGQACQHDLSARMQQEFAHVQQMLGRVRFQKAEAQSILFTAGDGAGCCVYVVFVFPACSGFRL